MIQMGKIFIIFLMMVSVSLQGSANYDDQTKWSGMCTTGKQQSPININTRVVDICPSNFHFKLKYQCDTVPFTPSDSSFKIVTSSSSYVGIHDQSGEGLPEVRLYRANSYHFHSPSEHTINNVQYDLQVHHFHVPLEDDEGRNATFTRSFANFDTSSYKKEGLFASVVGYLFYENDGPDAIDFDLDTNENGTVVVNMLQVFGYTSNNIFYNYRGSATTPDCQQNVDWFIYKNPIPIRKQCLSKIKQAINHGHPNNREKQPRNQRIVRTVGGNCLSQKVSS